MGHFDRRQMIAAAIAGGVIVFALGFSWLNRPGARDAALRDAVRRGDLGKTERLLRKGAEPNLPALNCSQPALQVAMEWSFRNKKEIVALLLDHGADPNAVLADGSPLVTWAMRNSEVWPDIVVLLAKAGADLNQRDRDGKTAFHIALATLARDKETIAVFLDAGADPNLQQKDGRTALHQVAWRPGPDEVEIAKALIAHGADPNAKDNKGLIPLAGKVSKKLIPLLIEAGSDLSFTKEQGLTPFEWVLRLGVYEAATTMVEEGADANIEDKSGTTPLFGAAAHGDMTFAKALVAQGANVNHVNQVGSTPLHRAAWLFHKDMVAYLVAQGAKVDAHDDKGLTPLALAKKAQRHAKQIEGERTPERAARRKAIFERLETRMKATIEYLEAQSSQ